MYLDFDSKAIFLNEFSIDNNVHWNQFFLSRDIDTNIYIKQYSLMYAHSAPIAPQSEFFFCVSKEFDMPRVHVHFAHEYHSNKYSGS